ncbi:hypothetical protein [Nocardioides sp.]|uniref:hypothetical protein n=1 Tax=Nocardioides sp. TaxID=35761 RepID=UPI002631757D|nr:hypothetical protein [Nocardioides sp.]
MTSGHEPPGPPLPGPPTSSAHPGYPGYPPASPGYGRFAPAGPLPEPEPSQAMARWALGLAIVPCGLLWLVGAGLAIAVLRRNRDGRNHGKKKAIGALVMAGLWVLLALAVPATLFAIAPDRSDSGQVTSEGSVAPQDLQVGDCVRDLLSEGYKLTVKVSPCAEPHQTEVFANFDLTDSTYPGDDETRALAEQGCFDRLQELLPRRKLARASVLYLYPFSGTSFREDPGVSCLVESDVPVTDRIVELPPVG